MLDVLNWSKVTVMTLIMLQKISIRAAQLIDFLIAITITDATIM